MEILLEIPEEKVKELNITDAKISFDELQRRLAGRRLVDAMHKAQEAAKMYGINNWTMEDINQVIKEARVEYEKENSGD